MEIVNGFRYRVEDVLRGVTKVRMYDHWYRHMYKYRYRVKFGTDRYTVHVTDCNSPLPLIDAKKVAIRDARMDEIKAEIVNSQKLKVRTHSPTTPTPSPFSHHILLHSHIRLKCTAGPLPGTPPRLAAPSTRPPIAGTCLSLFFLSTVLVEYWQQQQQQWRKR
jgi:hypothetical protein